VIDCLIAQYRAAGTDRGDLLSMLLNAETGTDEQHRPLSDTELRDQVITFFTGGMEPPANTLAWALYLVAKDGGLQERLEHEADTVLNGRTVTFDDLPNLRLTRNIITETLRLYPPAWLITRRTTTATELAGQRIEAGTIVFYSPYLIHHLPSSHPDPEHFDPDRWAGLHSDRPGHSGRVVPPERAAFVAFGAGPRQCMGDVFGLTETTMALAHIAAGWRLQPLTDRPVRPARGLSLYPSKLMMRLHRRTAAGQPELA
jgi:cytochrome P450